MALGTRCYVKILHEYSNWNSISECLAQMVLNQHFCLSPLFHVRMPYGKRSANLLTIWLAVKTNFGAYQFSILFVLKIFSLCKYLPIMGFKYVIERTYKTKYLLIFPFFLLLIFRFVCLNKGESFNLKEFTIHYIWASSRRFWYWYYTMINTSYLTDSYIIFTLKSESGQNFFSNRWIRSSTYGKKNSSDSPPCGKMIIFVIEFVIFHKTPK